MTGIRLETSEETGLVGVVEGRGRLPPPEAIFLVSRLAGMSFLRFCSGKLKPLFLTQFCNLRWQTTASTVTSSRPKDQSSRDEANYKARVDLATTYRALEFFDMGEGICNHLTLRAPSRVREEDVMLLIPYGMHWKEVTASGLLGMDFFTGEVIEGDGEPNISASCIHRPIHNARYPIDGMTAVLHTHQPYTTTIACMKDPEPFKIGLSQNSMRFLNKIAYDMQYDGFANVSDEGERLAKVLGDKDLNPYCKWEQHRAEFSSSKRALPMHYE
eukprot:XP_001180415.3 PREDICTED: adducin-related protein 2 [Strongylocentrotus purpuratus]